MTVNKALAVIEYIKSLVSVMGANDTELLELDDIKQRVLNRELDTQEAAQKAWGILHSKQDYH